MNSQLEKYFKLKKNRPELFEQKNNPQLIIELHPQVLSDYVNKHAQPIGLVYESDYHIVLVDLVHTGNKKYFTYERLISKSRGEATVMVTTYDSKFLLLRQYRHALRSSQLSFPRGFGTDGLSGEENAKKELFEEVHGEVKKIEKLGKIVIDSGISDKSAAVFHCDLSSLDVQIGYEGIEEYLLLTIEELHDWIKKGKITDSFTLISFYMYVDNVKDNLKDL